MIRTLIVLALFCPLLAETTELDVIELNNGDRLSGEIKALDKGSLALETDYAGEIQIDWTMVKSFRSVKELIVKTDKEETLTGRVRLAETDDLVISTKQQVVTIPRERLYSLETVPEPQDYGPLENWQGGMHWGFTLSRGNTDLGTLSFTADPTRTTRQDRIAIRFAALNSRKDGERDANHLNSKTRYDRFFSDRAFVYGYFGFEKDDEANLNYRFREGTGLGFELSPADHTSLSVSGGLAFFQEKFATLEEGTETEATIRSELSSTIFEPILLTARSTLSPVLSQDRYFFDFSSGLFMPIFSNLRFGIEVINLYDSAPPEDVQNNDFRLLTTLGWTF